nr:MAG TPA: hypothetical protein [Caudoviricetes sp.]
MHFCFSPLFNSFSVHLHIITVFLFCQYKNSAFLYFLLYFQNFCDILTL